MRGLLTGLTLVAFAAACTREPQKLATASATAADSADQVLYGVRMPLTEEGIKRGELLADTMYVMNDQTRFDFIKGLVTFNDSTGRVNGQMRADSGRFDQRTQILEGWGNVEVTTTDGRTLRSPQVTFNQLRNELSSDTSYTITRGNDVARGIGFTADPAFTRYQCRRACGGSATVILPTR